MRPGPGVGGTARSPSVGVPGRLMSRLGIGASPLAARGGIRGGAADELRQRLSPPFARTSEHVEHYEEPRAPCSSAPPSQRASAREREEELAAARLASEEQLAEEDRAALALASEEERQLAAAIRASLAERDAADAADDDTARQGAPRARTNARTAWASPHVPRPRVARPPPGYPPSSPHFKRPPPGYPPSHPSHRSSVSRGGESLTDVPALASDTDISPETSISDRLSDGYV